MKKMMTALMLLAAFTAQAEDTTTTAATSPASSTTPIGNILAKIKSAPVSVDWLLDSYAKSNRADGVSAENYFYIGYKIDKYHKVTVTPILTTDAEKAQRAQDQIHTKYLQTDLTFKRSSILTQDKNGVNLSASLGSSFYKDNEFDKNLETGVNFSRHHLSLSASRSIGNFSFSSGLAAYVYNRNTGSVKSTRNYSTLSFTPTYSFNDNLSLSLATIWYEQQAVSTYSNGHSTAQKLRFVPSLYASIGKFAAGLYFDGYVAQSHDIYNAFTSNWLKKGYVGLTMSYSIL